MMKFSLSTKVMLIYGAVFLVIITLTFGLSYIGTVGKLGNDLNDTNLALLKQVDQKMEVTFRQTEKDLLTLMNDLEFVYFMYDSYKDEGQKYSNFYGLNAKLREFINTNPQFSSIFVYSAVSGHLLTDKAYMKDTPPVHNWLGRYLDMPVYFKWLTTHQISDGNSTNDVITLVRSYPTISGPGYRKGIVAVNINEKVIYDMVNAVYEDRKIGHMFIIDNDGNIVTHDDKTQIYRNIKELPHLKDVLSMKGSGTLTGELNHVRQSIFYRDSNYTGWKLISIVPESQIYEPLKVTRNLLIALGIGMIIFALIVLFYVSRWTFKPLHQLIGKISGTYHITPTKERSNVGLPYLERVFDQLLLDREHLEQHVRDSKPVLKWRMMMDMLVGNRTDFWAIHHHLKFIGVHLFPDRYLVCTAEISKEGMDLSALDETLYTYVFCNAAEEMINTENAGIAIDIGGGRAAVIISFAEGDGEQNHLRALAIMELILDTVKQQFGLDITVGVGRGYREMKDIPKSYDESQKALHYKIVFGGRAVISIEDLQPLDSQDYYRLMRMADRITDALKLTDSVKLQAYVQETFREAMDRNLSPDLIRQLSFDLIVKSVQSVSSTGIDLHESKSQLERMYELINRSGKLQEMERLVFQFLEEMASKIKAKRIQRGSNETVDKILIYIVEHYHEHDLTLDKLAQEFHLSSTYISKLFKEHTESNFIDYLIGIRMNASQEHLAGTDMKVNEIAEAVGYLNTRSFIRTFKKHTGLTPLEYRSQTQMENTNESIYECD
ncbi:helix-turn-helix domain-containing protein [Paenibacillus guangzhouensis]|uniref:helix-turn-helix domain-containing protein n=1 Tax=Paenibacillus guangzhouensis TaxID=1473112 RepID=UPI001266B660|nr:helix-turn-helix domain-containing protein [Paenibacillus guangzhouensis]